jgi:hypothetical protein
LAYRTVDNGFFFGLPTASPERRSAGEKRALLDPDETGRYASLLRSSRTTFAHAALVAFSARRARR